MDYKSNLISVDLSIEGTKNFDKFGDGPKIMFFVVDLLCNPDLFLYIKLSMSKNILDSKIKYD